MRLNDRRFAALMMAPAAAFLLAFVAWPLVRFVMNGFYDISPIAGGPRRKRQGMTRADRPIEGMRGRAFPER